MSDPVCDPVSCSLRPLKDVGLVRISLLALASLVSSCHSHPASFRSASASPQTPAGNLTTGQASTTSTASTIAGWACAPQSASSIQVELYASGSYPRGTLIGEYTAGQIPTQPSPDLSCGGGFRQVGFTIPITPNMVFLYGGQSLSVVGLSSTGTVPAVLARSGIQTLPDYDPTPTPASTCEISDLNTLEQCLSNQASYQLLDFTQDVTCDSPSTCCNGNAAGGYTALLDIKGMNHLTIQGNGHAVHRAAAQTLCPALSIQISNEILVESLSFDEGEATPPCDPSTNSGCANAIDLRNDTDVKLQQVGSYFSKNEGVFVETVDGFSFSNSIVSESGQAGIWIGLGTNLYFTPSRKISINDSIIAKSRINGIALMGANPSAAGDRVILSRNVLTKNHWHGLYPIPGVTNGITSGGELLLADATGVTANDNLIADGYCENCTDGSGNPSGGVTAIELGGSPAPGGVQDLLVQGDYIYNGSQPIVAYQNPGTAVSGVSIMDTRAIGYSVLDAGFQTAPNILRDDLSDWAAPIASLAWNGYASQGGVGVYDILRLRAPNGYHDESKFLSEVPSGVLEGIFRLSPSPRVNAPANAIYRCYSTQYAGADFLSLDPQCEGRGTLHSVMGYSYEPGYVLGTAVAQPFYRCLNSIPGDEFVSWDPHCEGQTFELQLGFAVSLSSP